jgi:hypothetical protein
MLDVEFDFSKEAKGRDPDRHSPTLIKYHRMLWQKPLKDNKLFDLTFSEKNRLTHNSDLGVFELSSDTIGHTYRKWKRMAHIIKQIPKNDIDSFLKTCRTMGGYIVFPANKIDGNTINQERGTNTKIRDRWDLTVECIRRHYVGGESPLSDTLVRYSDFFSLFSNFKSYVEFFHLQDVVSDDFKKVKFFLPFDDFQRVPTPKTKEEYIAYRQAVMLFINQRNTRILESL